MIADFGGLSKSMPVYATIFMIMTMSSIGLPGLNGFIGEFAILQGAFQTRPWWAVAATSGIILGAAYMLWLFQRVMFGPISHANEEMKDLNAREIGYFAPLLVAAFWIGLYPKPVIQILEKPIEKLVMQVEPGYFIAEKLERDQALARQNGMKAMEAPAHPAAAPEVHGAPIHPAAAHEGGH
jgi:NADH-quinone oxidoreductase subunit M